MAEAVKAVPDSSPKKGKARQQSDVRHPYFDLDSGVEVARVIHERAGGTCDLAQLAALLDYSGVGNGAFRMRVSAAKMFGLVEGKDKAGLRPTKRALAIVAPVSEAAEATARLAAFMSVSLFRDIYQKFEGTSLPSDAGLRNLMENEFGILKDRAAPAVRVMMDSAAQAGLFRAAGRSRMVKPIGVSEEAETAMVSELPPPPPAGGGTGGQGSVGLGGGGGGGGDGDGFDGIDPAISGLLRRLPRAGTRLSSERRQKLIAAFTHTIDFLYSDEEGE